MTNARPGEEGGSGHSPSTSPFRPVVTSPVTPHGASSSDSASRCGTLHDDAQAEIASAVASEYDRGAEEPREMSCGVEDIGQKTRLAKYHTDRMPAAASPVQSDSILSEDGGTMAEIESGAGFSPTSSANTESSPPQLSSESRTAAPVSRGHHDESSAAASSMHPPRHLR